MLRLVADENFDNRILRAMRLRPAIVDAVRVQDVGLRQADDPTILEWASREGRVLLTHDVETMPGFAYARVRAGLPMTGVIVVRRDPSIGPVADAILAVALAASESELEHQVRFLSL